MGLYLHAKCKLCRRAGDKLFLRGDRCLSPKCAIVKRSYPPGAHGPSGAPRLTGYGEQLKEKQKAKRVYGLRERQVKNYYLHAKKTKGNTAQTFFHALEMRLDNVVYLLGFAKSRNQARQIVGHRHITLNGRTNNRPSTQLKVGDKIAIKATSIKSPFFQTISESLKKHEAPNWLKLEASEQTGQVINLPTLEDKQLSFNIRAIIEFYSR